MRKEWTADLDRAVDQGLAAGKSYRQIACELGMTRAMIAGRLNRRAVASREQHDESLRALEHRLGYFRVMQKGCRFVVGALGGDWRFCAAPFAPGDQSWCREHAKLVRGRYHQEGETGGEKTAS